MIYLQHIDLNCQYIHITLRQASNDDFFLFHVLVAGLVCVKALISPLKISAKLFNLALRAVKALEDYSSATYA